MSLVTTIVYLIIREWLRCRPTLLVQKTCSLGMRNWYHQSETMSIDQEKALPGITIFKMNRLEKRWLKDRWLSNQQKEWLQGKEKEHQGRGSLKIIVGLLKDHQLSPAPLNPTQQNPPTFISRSKLSVTERNT